MTSAWWQRGAIYQIYPRSFADSDGDGVGDLRGIAGRLDHLSALGVDVIWLSPVYPSPQDDNGYDIADYQGIEQAFGTLDEYDALLEAVHASVVHDRGLTIGAAAAKPDGRPLASTGDFLELAPYQFAWITGEAAA